MSKVLQTQSPATNSRKLRIGFVPLTDCAPIVMAHELGFFNRRGLNVALSRELGWATIRDKIIYGELDAAHAVAGLPFAATLGIGSVRCDCVTALVLNLHGNGITLSNELRRLGVTDAAKLRAEIQRSRGERIFTFGIVSPVSSHNFLLRSWLAAAGINPDRDVHIVVVPPPQMVSNLKSGNLDGFCAGEPWNSVAVQSRAGWCAAVSAELDPGHPEKVLMVRREFAEQREADHLVLVAALLDACEFCDNPANHAQLISTLARPEYVGASATALRCGVTGEFDFGTGVTRGVQDFFVFHRNDTNNPSSDKAAWVLQRMRAAGLCPESDSLNFALGRRVFRADLFEQAVRLLERSSIQTEPELLHA
ncbi:MAG: Bicarbonate transport ATP-binding protein CmpC [Verrucomicrobiota bacterium]|jgi:ABC-type nitrate/sulfonate/bicarbonate transport system substrate-binding protein